MKQRQRWHSDNIANTMLVRNGKKREGKGLRFSYYFLKLEAKLLRFLNGIEWSRVLVWVREKIRIIFVYFFHTSICFSFSLIFIHELIQLETFCWRTFVLLFISWKIQVRGIRWSKGGLVVWVHRVWLVENNPSVSIIYLFHDSKSCFIWINLLYVTKKIAYQL